MFSNAKDCCHCFRRTTGIFREVMISKPMLVASVLGNGIQSRVQRRCTDQPWWGRMRESSLNWASWCFLVCHLSLHTKFIWFLSLKQKKMKPNKQLLVIWKNSQKHRFMLIHLLLPLSWRSKHLFSEEPHSPMRGIYHHVARPFHHTNDNWPSPAITPTIFYHSCEKENHSFIRDNLAWHRVQVFHILLWNTAKRNPNQIQHANMTQANIVKMKINILQMHNPNLESFHEFKWNPVLHGTC